MLLGQVLVEVEVVLLRCGKVLLLMLLLVVMGVGVDPPVWLHQQQEVVVTQLRCVRLLLMMLMLVVGMDKVVVVVVKAPLLLTEQLRQLLPLLRLMRPLIILDGPQLSLGRGALQ
jgi:hypothetical protein